MSLDAAHAWEAVTLEEYAGDARPDDLLLTLTLYSPDGGEAYLVGIDALRACVVEALDLLADRPT